MALIFWSVFMATILLALIACPRKAAPVFILALLAVLILFGVGGA